MKQNRELWLAALRAAGNRFSAAVDAWAVEYPAIPWGGPQCVSANAPPERNLAAETRETLQAQVDLAPAQYAANKEYQPKYNALALQGIKDVLLGTPGGTKDVQYTEIEHVPAKYEWRPTGYRGAMEKVLITPAYDRPVLKTKTVTDEASSGLLDLYENQLAPATDRITAASQRATREAELKDLQELGPDVVAAYKAADPQTAGLLDALNADANDELAAGSSLTPAMLRELQQYYRGGADGRFTDTGTSGAGLESLYLGQRGQDLKNQRRSFAMQVMNANKSFGADPAQLLFGKPGNVGTAGSFFGQAGGVSGSAGTSSMFNPMNEYASDLYNTNYNANAAANIASANNKAALIGAGISAIGSIGKGVAMGCWIAREVYGERNPRWLKFRKWLYHHAPKWFKALYLKHGEAFAGWLADKPFLKAIIRAWMDTRIDGLEMEGGFNYAV